MIISSRLANFFFAKFGEKRKFNPHPPGWEGWQGFPVAENKKSTIYIM
jgi:hypothetical protein